MTRTTERWIWTGVVVAMTLAYIITFVVNGGMASLAAFLKMLARERGRYGLRVCRAAWLLGMSVRQYREIEAGDAVPTSQVYDRICEVFGWPGKAARPGHVLEKADD
jgi:hypothetical protein